MFFISFVRCGLPHSGSAPGGVHPLYWHSCHDHDGKCSTVRVGFLPVIPSPVTEYATVGKALTNFLVSRQQLNQLR